MHERIQPTAPVLSSAAFSADVEDYFQVEALRRICPREEWGRFEDRTEANTNRLLELLAQKGARGTFFILGWTAQRHPALVRRIAAAGHEVGSHGYDHELVYNQSQEEFRQDVRRARAVLQDISGKDVVGYRAPSYTIVERTLWALRILAEEGYAYDSSIFPIRRRRYGIPGAPRIPHRRHLDGGAEIVEFPLPTFRVGPINLPATGGAYLRLLPFELQARVVRRILDSGMGFVLTIHPWELDPGQPSLPVNLRTRWTHYHNLDRAEERLAKLLSLASFRPLNEVLQGLGLLAPPGENAATHRRRN